ncbi:HAMP domain-containing sensor histidine kinase [Actinomycetospora sp.]|jgi:two-component system OmpR family sensor kinase|uniref:sensor histidine kinase n=1 Tax=Actinomycetospora sp. TaxID=1872135 RepID=UPI002F413D3B
MAERLQRLRADRYLIDAGIAYVARIERTRVAARRARSTQRVVLNLAAVLAVVIAALTVLVRAGLPDPAPAAVFLMAGVASSAGSAAALMIMFAARLTGDSRVLWAGLTLGWYSLVAIPISTVSGLDREQETIAAAGIVLVHGVATVLWLVVLAAPGLPTAPAVVRGFLVAVAALVLGAVVWAAAAPAGAESAAGAWPVWVVYALVWIAGALAVVAWATVRRIPGLGAIGTGLAMLGALQAGRFVDPTASRVEMSLFAGLRLAAVVLVLWGSLRLVRRALLKLDDDQAAQEEELRLAELRLARAAERDHDLRNGLAGLAGATAVLGGGAGTGHLSRVVAGELRRLDVMLQVPSRDDRRGDLEVYPVGPALEGLVMLRRSAGMDVRADVEPALHAVGSPRTLAQVVTNLLANAERHAPGSPVRITAAPQEGRVEIRIRDFGPGIPVGRELTVFEPGVCDEQAGGTGLGLHLSRTLLMAEGATIDILSAVRGAPGCVVVIGLPVVERARPGRERDECRAAS